MLSNTIERKDRTKPITDWYPAAVISERITPAVTAHYMAKARRLRCAATAELADQGVNAVARGICAFLWPMSFGNRIGESKRS